MPDDLVLLGLASQLEARIWRDVLAQEGIPVLMRSADPLGPAGYAPAICDLTVYVRQSDERRARWIIGDSVEPPITVPQETRDDTAQRTHWTAEVSEEEHAAKGD